MKGTSLFVTIILALAVLGLYILHFTNKDVSDVKQENPIENTIAEKSLKIAYVKADSVLLNYDLAQDLHDEFTKKQEAYTNDYGNKRKSFEKAAAAFQEKLQRGGFLTEQRAIQERDKLLGREKQILKMDQELSTKLAELQTKNNQQLLDSLVNYLEIYNKDHNYDYILNGGTILIGDESTNVTNDILEGLNKRYGKEKVEE